MLHSNAPSPALRLQWIACGLLFFAGCVSIPPPSAHAPPQAPQQRTSDSWLDKAFRERVAQHRPESGFRLFSAGIEGLLLRIELIDKAHSSLDLQYYIFRCDDSGRLVQQAVVLAADRGVHVRIITDDGETVAGDEKLLLLAAHPQIELRVFNPFEYRGHNGLLRGLDFLFHKSRLDYRMHNKLMVVDGSVAVAGGRNIGDQYFQVSPDSQFADDDVLVAGPMVDRLAAEFAEYWNAPSTVDARKLARYHDAEARLARYREELRAPHPLLAAYAAQFDQRLQSEEPLRSIVADDRQLTWADAVLVYDSPEKRRIKQGERFGQLMYRPIEDKIAATRSELLMITPYFVPVPAEERLLADRVSHAVRVRILTNSLPAAPDLLAQAGYMRHRPTLLQDGIELYEIRADLGSSRGSGETKKLTRYGTYALHAKLFVFDRTAIFVGSMNLDQRSVKLNTEMGLIIASERLAEALTARFNALTSPENAYKVQLTDSGSHVPPRQITWRTEEDGKPLELRKEPARSGLQKFEVHLLSLFPLDGEL